MQTNYVRTESHSTRSWQQQRWTRSLPSLIIGLIALVGLGSVFDASFDHIMAPRMDNYRSELTKLRHAEKVLSDLQEGLLGYAVTGRPERLEEFLSSKKMVADEIRPLLLQLDTLRSTRVGTNGESALASHDFNELQADWESWSALAAAICRRRPTSRR
jgi:hypothetical protein